MSIKIKKFNQDSFGSLTTLISDTTGKVMFIAREAAELWGYKDANAAIRYCKLNDDEKLLLKKKQHKSFFDQLTAESTVTSKTPSITLVSESALYKMALNSRMPKAEKIKDWIARDVLPSIRETGSYSINDPFKQIGNHTHVSIQKSNSKAMNSLSFEKGGVGQIRKYNIESCVLHTGRKPSEIKEIGKQLGLKSAQRTSAKEVLRNTQPHKACAMSFTDEMVANGIDLNAAAAISVKHAAPLFEAMLRIGIKPAELSL